MQRRHLGLLAAIVLIGLWLWTRPSGNGDLHAPVTTPAGQVSAPAALPATGTQYPAFLPREAHDVLARIAQGGPYAHRQDGSVFQNREKRLPAQPRGYYREYTVETPGSDDRGARRIITGGDPPVEYWYTQDHYRSFRRFELPPLETRR
ncbi:ribonuclease [Lysobacter sp. S4-A87]|uniref:ribonuclease domain-containing protein n=1 Tax=Lysobacter sp. S4-A87 TaxID=2925843 RepID=UPI001F533FDB|nr:ribonuclease domain-containing protein [Lysobacter sp. S4-A87]UNK48320.1 ribonuclease [Lysobacter sp. S4-A87]